MTALSLNPVAPLLAIVALLLGAVATPAAAQQRYVFRVQARQGEKWSFDTVNEMRMTNKMVSGGQILQQMDGQMLQRRKGIIQVTEVRPDGLPTAIVLTLDPESVSRMSMPPQGEQNIPHPLAGRPIVVAWGPEGIKHNAGERLDPAIDFELKGFLLPDTSFYPQQPVTIGQRWQPPREALDRNFQLTGGDQAEMTCTLVSVNSVNGREVAEIGVTGHIVKHTSQGPMVMMTTMNLQGRMMVDLLSGRVVDGEMRGQTHMEPTSGGGGMVGQPDIQQSNMKLIGDGTYTYRTTVRLLEAGAAAGPTGPTEVNVPPLTPPGSDVGGAPPPPISTPRPIPTAAAGYYGRYGNERMTITFVPGPEAGAGTVEGAIELGEQHFPLTARFEQGRLVGQFEVNGQPFDFTAQRRGNELKLTSGGVIHTLQRLDADVPVNPINAGSAENPIGEPSTPRQPAVPMQPASPSSPAEPCPPTPPAPSGGVGDPYDSSKVLLFHKQSIPDPDAGCDALTLLVPAGYQCNARFAWRSHTYDPCPFQLQVKAASGEEMTLFPSMRFTYGFREQNFDLMVRFGLPAQYRGDPRAAMASLEHRYPDGSNIRGNELRPMPQDSQSFVRQYVLPRCRPDVRDYRIVSHDEMPQVAQQLMDSDPAKKLRVWSARTRIEYSLAGHPVEEELSFHLCTVPLAGREFLWGVDGIQSLRAGKGRLDQAAPALRASAMSIRPTVQWFHLRRQICDMAFRGAMQQLQTMSQIAQIQARTSSEINDMIWDQYRKTEASHDRTQQVIINQIKGVEQFNDTFAEQVVELPSGYRDYWVNGAGEYILSNEVGFDPNVGSVREWRRMQTVKP